MLSWKGGIDRKRRNGGRERENGKEERMLRRETSKTLTRILLLFWSSDGEAKHTLLWYEMHILFYSALQSLPKAKSKSLII